ncbi:ATP-binding protein [Zhaonella formicivorans]|jgi:anti-sigma regulatory factor (Ser/Thr protein kinase)|uniref:ATP-binding protein n=1 Tax=Zhaonella formicivorans TaxID=2528593 RepID=UPI001D0FAC73|nr:anti-sigma regulatory factor [Zhaonella formicivorans]
MKQSENVLVLNFTVQSMDFKAAGQGASKIKQVLQQIGVDNAVIRRIAIITYEAELNIIIHAYKGEIRAIIAPEFIEIVAEDSGPGISDIEQAMREGFSTAPSVVREMGFGAGMGLPNIKRSADELEITSEVGVGTKLSARVYYPCGQGSV